MKTITCPQCGTVFELANDPYDDRPETLLVWSCESGGVYSIIIRCPGCGLEESVK